MASLLELKFPIFDINTFGRLARQDRLLWFPAWFDSLCRGVEKEIQLSKTRFPSLQDTERSCKYCANAKLITEEQKGSDKMVCEVNCLISSVVFEIQTKVTKTKITAEVVYTYSKKRWQRAIWNGWSLIKTNYGKLIGSFVSNMRNSFIRLKLGITLGVRMWYGGG